MIIAAVISMRSEAGLGLIQTSHSKQGDGGKVRAGSAFGEQADLVDADHAADDEERHQREQESQRYVGQDKQSERGCQSPEVQCDDRCHQQEP